MFSKTNVGYAAAFLFIYSMYGYPLQSAIPYILQVSGNPINITIRALLLGISCVLIVIAAADRPRTYNLGFVWLIVFWIMYSTRLIYDLEIKNVKFVEESKFYVYSFAFGTCLLPAIAVYLHSKSLNLKFCLKLTFWLLLLSNISLVYTLLSYNSWSLAQVFLSRASVMVEVGGQEISIVNGITISYYGQLLALLSIFFIRLKVLKGRLSLFFLISTSFLGILNLLMGASRGPLIFFVLILVFGYILTSLRENFNILRFLKNAFGGSVIIGIGLILFFQKFSMDDLQIFSRMQASYDEHITGNVKEDRDYQWESALAQFESSPVFGDKFVNNFDHSYAHNLFLDVLMSLGLIGFVVFSMMLRYVIPKYYFAISIIKSDVTLFFFLILFLGEFLMGLTSGGIFVAINFWLLSAFALGYSKYVPVNKNIIDANN